MLKTQEENPDGLHLRYCLTKRDGTPIDEGSEYFILRLDSGGSDPQHIRACRIAVQAYAAAIANHLPKLAADIRAKYNPDEINTFCEVPGKVCTFGYCDENGCNERTRVVMRGTSLGPTEGASAGNSIQNAVDSFAGVNTGRKNRKEENAKAKARLMHESKLEAPEAENLVAGLSGQIERVGKLVELYESVPNGKAAAAFMKADLEKGRAALQSGDIADMVSVFKDLQGYSE